MYWQIDSPLKETRQVQCSHIVTNISYFKCCNLWIWKEWQVLIRSNFSCKIKLCSIVPKTHTYTRWGKDILEHCSFFFLGWNLANLGHLFHYKILCEGWKTQSLSDTCWWVRLSTTTSVFFSLGKLIKFTKFTNWCYFFKKLIDECLLRDSFSLPKYWIFLIKKNPDSTSSSPQFRRMLNFF